MSRGILNAKIFSYLGCPMCKGFPFNIKHLLKNGDIIIEGEIVCSQCNRKYSISDGIPDMLPDEIRLQKPLRENGWIGWRKRLELFNERMREWTEEDSKKTIPLYEEFFQRFCQIKGSVLEIGCGNGVVRQYLDENVDYWGIDPEKSWTTGSFQPFAEKMFPRLKIPFPFILAVGEHLPFKDATFDNIIIVATLDHVNSPSMVFKESRRVLKRKGRMFLFGFIGEDKIPKARVATSLLKRNFRRVLRGNFYELLRGAGRRLWGRVENDLLFSMDEIIKLFQSQGFTDLQIHHYSDNLKFFKARKSDV